MTLEKIPVSIRGVLQETLQAHGLGHILLESRLRRQWTELMGERAARIAEMISLKDGVLCIQVTDAAWRHELHYQCDALRKRANNILGANTVKDIRLR